MIVGEAKNAVGVGKDEGGEREKEKKWGERINEYIERERLGEEEEWETESQYKERKKATKVKTANDY